MPSSKVNLSSPSFGPSGAPLIPPAGRKYKYKSEKYSMEASP
jgi:hypothetical protein